MRKKLLCTMRYFTDMEPRINNEVNHFTSPPASLKKERPGKFTIIKNFSLY